MDTNKLDKDFEALVERKIKNNDIEEILGLIPYETKKKILEEVA